MPTTSSLLSLEYATTVDPKMIYISSLSLFVVVFLFLFEKLILKPKRRLPPGPPKLPIIGNMNYLTGPAPHRALADLALKYGPLMHLQLGFVSTVVVSSAEMAKEIMKTNDLIFANRPKLVAPGILGYNYTDVAFAPYGAYWRQLRKICVLELLTAKRVDSYATVRQEEVARFLREIATSCSKPFNLADKLFELNHSVITRVSFGKSLDQLRFKKAMKEGTMLAAGFFVGDFFPSLDFVGSITGMKARLKKSFMELDSITGEIIEEHIERNKVKKPEHEDLLDVLLRLKDSGELEIPITIDNIKSVLLDLLTGATENSSNSVEWAMTELIKHPEMMKKAQSEVRQVVVNGVEESDLQKLSYLKLIVKETLRKHPPVPFLLPRESVEKCVINGYEIPAKTRVIVNDYAISRDKNSWENPDMFVPERFEDGLIDFKGQNFELVPFGAGRRICPGISFGIANIELALASLLYYFDWKLPEGVKEDDVDMNETIGMTLFKTNNLFLVPTLRFPLPT